MNKIAQVDIGNEFNSPIGVNISLADLVSIILSNAVAFAAVILFILMVVGGASYVIGAGQNDPQKMGQGQKALTAAVIGFIIIFATYWIIQLVEMMTGLNILGT